MNDEILLAMSDNELEGLVGEALTNYRNGDIQALSDSALANSSLTEPGFLEGEAITPAGRGRVMRSMLHWGVDTLHLGGQQDWMAFEWRSFNVLNGFHMQGMRVAELAELMGIATQTFYQSRERAVSAVSKRLRKEVATPQAIEERQQYAIADLYASRSPDEQLILRITCIFDDLIPTELLHQLALEANGQNIQKNIHNLLNSHLLLRHERKTEISIHPQLQPHLLTLLVPQERKSWHHAAATYYEKQLAYIDAAHHFRHAGAYEPAANLLINHYQAIVDDNQVAKLPQILKQFQLPEVSREQLAQLNLVAGQAAEFLGNLNDAIDKYGKALGANNVRTKAKAYYRRAKVFEGKNIDEALTHYEVGINLLARHRGVAPQLLVKMYIDNVFILIQERPNFDQAAVNLTRAEKLIQRDEHLAEWADLHNAWASLFRSKKEFQNAISPRLKAWVAANELQDVERIIKIGHNLGIDYMRIRQYERALEYLKKGRKRMTETGNRKNEGAYNDHIGACHFWLKEYDEARRYYHLAYDAHVASQNDGERGHTCYNLAEVYLELGEAQKAKRYFSQGVAIAKEVGDERLLALFDKLFPQTELNERQQKGLEHVKQHGKIANRIYREVTGATQKQARNDLKDLLEKRVFKKEGKGRSVRYVLVESGT